MFFCDLGRPERAEGADKLGIAGSLPGRGGALAFHSEVGKPTDSIPAEIKFQQQSEGSSLGYMGLFRSCCFSEMTRGSPEASSSTIILVKEF